MSQLPDEIYVSEDSKYGTLDYVIAYTFFEDGNYDREDMQEYIPTYRCEEKIAESKKKMVEKACEWMRNFKNDKGEFPLYDYIGNFRKAMEEY